MRNCLSFGETLVAVMLAALLSMPQALAEFSDYSTDLGEADIITVRNDHCCKVDRIQEEANVKLNVEHALLTTYDPVRIQVLDATHQEVAHISTRDEVIYMYLPEGKYTIEVNASDHASLNVDASDATLQNYAL